MKMQVKFSRCLCLTFTGRSLRLSLPDCLSVQQKGKLSELTIIAGLCNPGFQESVRNNFTIDLKRYEEILRYYLVYITGTDAALLCSLLERKEM